MDFKIENKTTTLPRGPDEEGTFSYSELLGIVVRSSPTASQGVTLGEMSDRLDLEKALKAANGKEELFLEPKRAALLKKLLSVHRWPVMHEDLVAMGDAVGVPSP